ncbi:ABC transporter permease [Embleya sp. NPDC020630]|uniref:ABC transporter permease n=1 Tax=Embleya sp. NPDC020630 TaxID=3363979 RepID=UPI0037ADD0BC
MYIAARSVHRRSRTDARIGWWGEAWRYATNRQDSPYRTASTAAALMIGVAVVGAMSVVGATASAERKVDRDLAADFVVAGDGKGALAADAGNTGFPVRVADAVRAVPGIAVTARERQAPIPLEISPANGATWTRLATLYGEDPSFPALLRERYTAGDPVRALSGPDAIVVAGDYARAHGLRLGDAVRVRARGGGRETTLFIGALRESDPPGGSIGRVRGAPAIALLWTASRPVPWTPPFSPASPVAPTAPRPRRPCVVPLPITRR